MSSTTTKDMNTGAKAALSGFRKQALFILASMIDDADSKKEFHPEGEEDLAIYEGGKLTRVVQVKALSNPLTLSNLNSQKSQEELLFLRVASLSECQIEVASFGPLGPELAGFQSGNDSERKKIEKKVGEKTGLPTDTVVSLLDRLQINTVDEDELENKVLKFFRAGPTAAGNPQHAFDLLTWWIYRASEERRRITFAQFRDQLQAIGRYLAERKAKHDEWFTTIKPLEEERAPTADQREKLADQYYRGAAARYSHICADLDVRRDELLAEIDAEFQAGKQVVILHGASGQGKTTLALRYLHDNVPAEWRFRVEAIDNRRHAASVANALADHLHVVEAPVYLLIDVAPTDLEWVALVRELLDRPNIRVLVAIREEDLARRRASDAELGFPAEVPLEFSEHEAEPLYTRLVERSDAVNAFPSFADAWERFGGEGPLLEFVYLITQTDSLRSVLGAQINRLRDEVHKGELPKSALKFLHMCAIATAYETRMPLRPLAEHLELPDPAGILRKLEDEYLLRQSPDQDSVEALHPFRSLIIAEVLDDPIFGSNADMAVETLPLLRESDLEVMLLYVFSRHQEKAEEVIEALSRLGVQTWTGAAGVMQALLWLGIKNYLDTNRQTINEAEEEVGAAWVQFLLPDIAGAGEGNAREDILEAIRPVKPELTGRLEQLRGSLSPTEDIFAPAVTWLQTMRLDSSPQSISDWQAAATLLTWSSRLEVSLNAAVDMAMLPIEELPLEDLADLAAALYRALPDQYADLLSRYDDAVRERFRRETQSLVLEDNDDEIYIEFVIPQGEPVPENESSSGDFGHWSTRTIGGTQQGESTSPKFDTPGASLNDRAVSRASILRRLYPERQRYCTQGRGHAFASGLAEGLELEYDESYKRLVPEAMPLPKLVDLNATFVALATHRHRQETWKDFAALLLEIRSTLAGTLLALKRGLDRYFSRSQPSTIVGKGRLTEDLWDQTARLLKETPQLPLAAVDEWGFSSDTRAVDSKNGVTQRSFSIGPQLTIRRHQQFRKPINAFLNSANHFFQHAYIVCVSHGNWGRRKAEKAKIIRDLEKHGYGADKLRLSKYTLFELMTGLRAMQEAFEKRLGPLVDSDLLNQVTERENKLFPSLWALWYQFCHNPELLWDSASIRSMSAFESCRGALRTDLLSCNSVSASWSVSILSEHFEWKSRPALVLGLDIPSVPNLISARAEAVHALGEALQPLEVGSLRQYALDYYWPHILLVPMHQGRPMSLTAWVLPSFVFQDVTNQGTVDRPWLQFPEVLLPEHLEEIGLEPVEATADVAQLLEERFAEYLGFLLYISSFSELLPDLDDTGLQVLEHHLDRCLVPMGAVISDLARELPDFLDEARNNLHEHEVFTILLVDPLQEFADEINSAENNKVMIELMEAGTEAERIKELLGHVTLLGKLDNPETLAELVGLPEESEADEPE